MDKGSGKKKYKEYRCIKELELRQLFLLPDMDNKVILQPNGIWIFIESNKKKGIVVLEYKGIQPLQMRCTITMECFREHFEEV